MYFKKSLKAKQFSFIELFYTYDILLHEYCTVYRLYLWKCNWSLTVTTLSGVYNTYQRLLPPNIASGSQLMPLVQTSEHGPGCMSVFVGINCDAQQLDILHKKNAWVYTGNDVDKVVTIFCSLLSLI